VVAAGCEGGAGALVLVYVGAAGSICDFVGDGAVGDAAYSGVGFGVCLVFPVVGECWVGY